MLQQVQLVVVDCLSLWAYILEDVPGVQRKAKPFSNCPKPCLQ